MVLALVMLTGCSMSTMTLKRDNPDGTTTIAEAKNPLPMMRQPTFKFNPKGLVMVHENVEWYEIEIAASETVESYREGKLIAESSNMKVYEAGDNSERQYLYVMDMEGTKDSCMVFHTDANPEYQTVDNDFSGVHYYVDKTETVPDRDGLALVK